MQFRFINQVVVFLIFLCTASYAGSLTPPGVTGDVITNGGNNQFGAVVSVPVANGGTGGTTAQTGINNLLTDQVGTVAPIVVPCKGYSDEQSFASVTPAYNAPNAASWMLTGGNHCVLDNQWKLPGLSQVVLSGGSEGTSDFNTGTVNGYGVAPRIGLYGPGIAASAPGAAAIDMNGSQSLVLNDIFINGTNPGTPMTMIENSTQSTHCCAANMLQLFNASLDQTNGVLGAAIDNNLNPIRGGGLLTGTLTTGGSGYVNGTYYKVPVTGGTGTNAYFDEVVVSGGSVTAAYLINPPGAANIDFGYPGSGYTAAAITSGHILTAGTGYVTGTYNSVPLGGGGGLGATANITVGVSGNVTSVTIVDKGVDYTVGNYLGAQYGSLGNTTGSGFVWYVDTVGNNDVLSAPNASLGGSGSGFTFTASTITKDTLPGTYANVLVHELKSSFGAFGCGFCTNQSDIYAVDNEFTVPIGAAIQPMYGGGGNHIISNRFEYTNKGIWYGGPNSSPGNGDTIISENDFQVTYNGFDEPWRISLHPDIEIDSGAGYIVNNNSIVEDVSTNGASIGPSFVLGGPAAQQNAQYALKDITITGNNWSSFGAGSNSTECLDIENGGDGYPPTYVSAIGNVCDTGSSPSVPAVHFGVVPLGNWVVDFVGPQGLHAEAGRPFGIGTSAPNANATLDLGGSTKALQLPIGTTGTRPTATAGMIRYNSSTPGIEAYYNSTWNTLGSGGGGGGTVTGPATTTSGYVPQWSNTTGTTLGTGLPVGVTGNSTIVETTSGGLLTASLLPNPSATTLGGVESIAAVSHNFLTTISTSGVPSLAQPLFSDISGTIAAGQLTAGTVIGSTSPTTNDMLYYHAGAWTDLPIGTSGYVLQSNGASTAPSWVALTGGGTVTGPVASTSGYVATWNGTGGTTLGTGLPVGSSGASTVLETSAGGTIGANTTGSAASVSGVVAGANGGTGVANTGDTITLGGNVTTTSTVSITGALSTAAAFSTSGANTLVLTTTGATNVTLPTTGTLLTTTGSGASLTALNATQLTTGTVPAARLPTPTATTLGGVESLAAVSHSFLTSITTSGVPTQTQPAFTDIAGTIASTQLTAGVVIGSTSPVRNDMLYYNGTNWVDVGIGTSGYVLTSQGATTAPSWTNVSGISYPGAGIPNSTGSAWGTSYGVTGTGSVVLSASPTLTGTITAAAAAFSGAFSAIGSTGIGTASPLAPLDVNGGAYSRIQAAGTQTAGGTLTPNLNTANSVSFTFGAGNLTIANPSNIHAGQNYTFVATQDSSGSRTITWGSAFNWGGGAAPTLSTGASAVDLISCFAPTNAKLICALGVSNASP